VPVLGSVLVVGFRCRKGGYCFGWVLFWLVYLAADFAEIARTIGVLNSQKGGAW